MVIIELTYKKPISEVEKHLTDHKAFLNKNYNNKMFLASGAKVPRAGGIILSNKSLTELKNIITEDPFYKHDIAEYRLIEFNPTMSADGFSKFLKD